jgi:hypothetical protein
MASGIIEIRGGRENNLRGVDLTIPKHAITINMAVIVDQKRLGGGSHSTVSTITDIYTVPVFAAWENNVYAACGFFDVNKKLSKLTKDEMDLLLHGTERMPATRPSGASALSARRPRSQRSYQRINWVTWTRLPQVSFSMAIFDAVTSVGGMVNSAPCPFMRS